MINVQPHVLRYWETEFLQLKPEKDEQGQRVYAKRDIDVLLRIRELLYVGKHTITSARKELSKEFG
jgi:DNA-binding transcriptional MerR regulator